MLRSGSTHDIPLDEDYLPVKFAFYVFKGSFNSAGFYRFSLILTKPPRGLLFGVYRYLPQRHGTIINVLLVHSVCSRCTRQNTKKIVYIALVLSNYLFFFFSCFYCNVLCLFTDYFGENSHLRPSIQANLSVFHTP